MEATLVFNPDQERVCFDIPVLEDQMDEGTEDFMVEITNVSPGVGTGRPRTTVISIIDSNGEMEFADNYTYTVLNACTKLNTLPTVLLVTSIFYIVLV